MWHLKKEVNEPYVAVENVFSAEELDTLLKLAEDDKKQAGSTVDRESKWRNSQVRWIDIETDVSLHFAYRKLTDMTTAINNSVFNFELNAIEPLQFTEYKVNGFYSKHQDFGYDKAVYRKLSLVVQLSDEDAYEGGDLVIYDGTEGGKKVPRKKNTLIAFPSWQLHEVLPVIRGVRHSLVGWVNGSSRFK